MQEDWKPAYPIISIPRQIGLLNAGSSVVDRSFPSPMRVVYLICVHILDPDSPGVACAGECSIVFPTLEVEGSDRSWAGLGWEYIVL